MPTLAIAPEKIHNARSLACATRLTLRKIRKTNKPEDVENFLALRAEMQRRGMNDRYGIFGWDDVS